MHYYLFRIDTTYMDAYLHNTTQMQTQIHTHKIYMYLCLCTPIPVYNDHNNNELEKKFFLEYKYK